MRKYLFTLLLAMATFAAAAEESPLGMSYVETKDLKRFDEFRREMAS